MAFPLFGFSNVWTGFSWWPLWHGGMPIQNTYAPLFHWSVALLSTLSGMSAFRSHHLLTGLAYALTFDRLGLTPEDLERVRAAKREG